MNGNGYKITEFPNAPSVGGDDFVPTVQAGVNYKANFAQVAAYVLSQNGYVVNPITTPGDLIYGNVAGIATRLGVGTNGQVLTLSGGLPAWVNSASGFTNPMTTVGDLIRATTGGAAVRLPIGSDGQFLGISGGVPTWSSPTGAGDVVGPASAVTARIATFNGTTGKLIQDGGATIAQLAPLASPTFTGTVSGITKAMVGLGNVDNTSDVNKPVSTATQTALNAKLATTITTTGDIIYSSSGATAARLGIGGTNQVLTVIGGVPTWQTPSSGFANPMTTAGDLITGGASGTPGRLGIGGNGTFLGVVAGSIAWTTPSGSGDVVGPGSSVSGNLPTFNGTTGKLLQDSGTALSALATLASPTFTGTPAAPTASGGTNTTQIATTAFVTAAAALKANIASPTFTGTVTIPSGASIAGFAPLASPALTGTPTAPTASAGTNNTQVSTTAYADASSAAARLPAVQSVTSSTTVTPTFSNDLVKITAQAAGLTLANPSGTAVDGWGIVIRIKDNGTARSISYGTQYRAIGVTLPTTTVISKTLYLACIWNNDDTKLDVLAVGQEA